MDLYFNPTDARILLSAERGIQIHFGMKIKSDSPKLEFPGGDNIEKCIFSLWIHPASQNGQELGDGRLGEISPGSVKISDFQTPTGSLVELRARVLDDQFNVVYAELSKGNLPFFISIGISDEPERDGLRNGVWTGPNHLAIWNIEFLFKLGTKSDT